MFSGRIYFTNSETKWPFIPWPSQTPNKYLPCFIKFYRIIKESWLILFFFSGQNPHLLQWAILVTISYYFLPFPYFVKRSHHYFGFTFIFYCDFVFVCLSSFLPYFGTSFEGSFWIILFRQLIVFLWSFFFFKSLVEDGSFIAVL